MKVESISLMNEAFGTVVKCVNAKIDGKYYRVFGEGEKRFVHEVITMRKQPKVTGKKRIAEILNAVDSFQSK